MLAALRCSCQTMRERAGHVLPLFPPPRGQGAGGRLRLVLRSVPACGILHDGRECEGDKKLSGESLS